MGIGICAMALTVLSIVQLIAVQGLLAPGMKSPRAQNTPRYSLLLRRKRMTFVCEIASEGSRGTSCCFQSTENLQQAKFRVLCVSQ